MSQLTAIRLLDADEPAGPLLKAVRDLSEGRFNKATYQVEPDSFRQVPNAPFAYWVNERIRQLFIIFPLFQDSKSRVACITNQVSNDNRYYRCSWEPPSNQIGQNRWVPLAKGGAYSPYYTDIHLLVDWDNEIGSYKGFVGTTHRPLTRPASVDYFFRPGLTWSRRTSSCISMRILPADCIFANLGPALFTKDSNPLDLLSVLSISNSQIFIALIELQLGAADAAARAYEVGIIQRTPIPKLSSKFENSSSSLATSAWSTKRSTDTANQTSHAFYAPALSPGQFGSRNKKATTA